MSTGKPGALPNLSQQLNRSASAAEIYSDMPPTTVSSFALSRQPSNLAVTGGEQLSHVAGSKHRDYSQT